MKIGALVQARMGSTRLPGKVLMKIGDKIILKLIYDRLRLSKMVNFIAIATTDKPNDKTIIDFAEKNNIPVFAGDEDDVLDRFYQAAKKFRLDIIVRITGDCPLVCHEIVDELISMLLDKDADYANNVDPPTFPDGLDVEVFTFKALEKAWKQSDIPLQREHVTPYIRENKDFKKVYLYSNINLSWVRLTVDYPEDLDAIRTIIKELPGGHI